MEGWPKSLVGAEKYAWPGFLKTNTHPSNNPIDGIEQRYCVPCCFRKNSRKKGKNHELLTRIFKTLKEPDIFDEDIIHEMNVEYRKLGAKGKFNTDFKVWKQYMFESGMGVREIPSGCHNNPNKFKKGEIVKISAQQNYVSKPQKFPFWSFTTKHFY